MIKHPSDNDPPLCCIQNKVPLYWNPSINSQLFQLLCTHRCSLTLPVIPHKSSTLLRDNPLPLSVLPHHSSDPQAITSTYLLPSIAHSSQRLTEFLYVNSHVSAPSLHWNTLYQHISNMLTLFGQTRKNHVITDWHVVWRLFPSSLPQFQPPLQYQYQVRHRHPRSGLSLVLHCTQHSLTVMYLSQLLATLTPIHWTLKVQLWPSHGCFCFHESKGAHPTWWIWPFPPALGT